MTALRDNLLIQLSPLLILAAVLLSHDEATISVGMLAVIAISFCIKYYRNEWKVLLLGMAVGLCVEFVGDLMYQAQYWQDASFFGLPLWLPLLWGYGFVMIRRLGDRLMGRKL